MRIAKFIVTVTLLQISLSVDIFPSANGIYLSYVGNYRKATVPIMAEFSAGEKTITVGQGTGFLINYSDSDGIYEFLVTAKHVLKDANHVKIIFNRLALTGDYPDRPLLHPSVYPLEKQNKRFWSYPKDNSIDVAVVFLRQWKTEQERKEISEKVEAEYRSGNTQNTILDNASFGFHRGVDLENLYSDDQLHEVFFLGYPLGLISQFSAAPIVRTGSIALSTLRGVQNYNPEAFLISGNVYPGNSGGPVIIKRTFLSNEKIEITTEIAGIISAYLPYQDIAVSEQTRRPRIMFEENTGLAIVYPSKFIQESIDNYLRK